MERGGDIPLGSTQQLRKQTRMYQKAELNSVLHLINAVRHVMDVDELLPNAGCLRPRARTCHDLLSKPVLIMTADEERKQKIAFVFRNIFVFGMIAVIFFFR